MGDPRISATSKKLKNHETIELEKPNTDGLTSIEPAAAIVIEYPLGREPTDMKPLIDVVTHVDIPLEISLARRLKRNIEYLVEQGRDITERITDDVTYYSTHYWPYYLAVRDRMRKTADL